MTERQRRFCEHYAECSNAAEAARRAGYAQNTARSQGQRLLTKDDIQAYIKELQEATATVRISSLKQVKAFWSDVMNDKDAKISDRLKASELLAKSAGAFFMGRAEDTGKNESEDVIIYLPEIDCDDV